LAIRRWRSSLSFGLGASHEADRTRLGARSLLHEFDARRPKRLVIKVLGE